MALSVILIITAIITAITAKITAILENKCMIFL